MKKNIFAILFVILLFSCTQKKEETKPIIKTEDQLITEKAAPNIAEEIGNLDINIALTKNKALSKLQREEGLNWMAKNAYEYMCKGFSIDSIDKNSPEYSKFFSEHYKYQTDYIVKKWKENARQELYKMKLQDSIIAGNK